MTGDVNIAPVARLLGDRARAAICPALPDGRFRTAGELARLLAGTTPVRTLRQANTSPYHPGTPPTETHDQRDMVTR